MIPQTFPSVLDANNRTQMVIYMLPSVAGLTKWTDYIPVKSPANESNLTLLNRYEKDGFIYTTTLTDIAGKQAWKDYIPVFIDGSAAKEWSADNDGYIPMSGLAALLLDFTTGRLDPRITFTRTSNATITKSDGTIGYAPHNLLTYSEQFDNAAWTKSSVIISSNITNTTAPNGTYTADKLIADTFSGQHRVNLTPSSITGTQTFSVYAKAEEYSGLWLRINLSGGYFNLLNGVCSGDSGVTVLCNSIGNGWYRCSITANAAANDIVRINVQQTYNGGDFSGNNTSGIYIWGAQLEIGSTATTYNPTTVKNLLGFTEAFDNAAWTKSNSFVQTNLLTYSEAFDNAAWTKLNLSVTANSVNAPNGYQTADSITETATNAEHAIYIPVVSVTSGAVYTLSAYIKSNGRTWARVDGFDTADFGAWFNLSTGAIGTKSVGVTASIVDAGNGWYRCSITKTISANSVVPIFRPAISDNDSKTYLGDITKGLYIWGAQLVQGSTAGDYRRTDAAALPVFYPNHNGVVCAEKLIENTSANASHWIFGSNTLTATPYVMSIYAKAGERNWVKLSCGVAGTPQGAFFNLATGATGAVDAGITAFAPVNVGNGWYRLAIGFTGTAAGYFPAIRTTTADNTSTYTGDGTSGIYIFGAQLSDSASLDPYVLNAGAAPSAAAYYGPRFDYDPVTLAPKGLLIEEQRSNLCLRSDNLNNASWTAFNSATLTNNSTISPDGTQNADTINFAANATSQYYQLITAGSATYTVSVWAKVASGTGEFRFKTNNGSTDTFSTNQAVTTSWQRFTFTNTTVIAQIALVNSSSAVAQSIIFWGAQLEAGAFATSYIPTAASAVTRTADVATIAGSNFYSWYNQNEGSFSINAEQNATSSTLSTLLSTHIDLTNNSFSNYFLNNSAASIQYSVYDSSGTLVVNLNNNLPLLLQNTYKKSAFAYAFNNSSQVSDNGAVQDDTSCVTNAPAKMSIGARLGVSQLLNGHIKQISYYNLRLDNSVLQGLTA